MAINTWTKLADGDWSETAFWSGGQPNQLSEIVADNIGYTLSHTTGSTIVQQMNATQDFALTGGTLNLQGNGSNSFGDFSQANSTLQVRGPLLIDGDAHFGSFSRLKGDTVGQSSIIVSGATTALQASVVGATFMNEGAMTLSGGNGQFGLALGAGPSDRERAVFRNDAGGTFVIVDDSGVTVGNAVQGFGQATSRVYYGELFNAGMFRKAGGLGTSKVVGTFNNETGASIEVHSGTLHFQHDRLAMVNAGAIHLVSGDMTVEGEFRSTGMAMIAAGTTLTLTALRTIENSHLAHIPSLIEGGLWQGGGTLVVHDPVSLQIAGSFTSSVSIINSSRIQVTGTATMSGGLINDSAFEILGLATLSGGIAGGGVVSLLDDATLRLTAGVASSAIALRGVGATFFVGGDAAATGEIAGAPSPAYSAALGSTRFAPETSIVLEGVEADAALRTASGDLQLLRDGVALTTLNLAGGFDASRHFAVRSDGAGNTVVVQQQNSGFHFNADGFEDILLRDRASDAVSYWSLTDDGFAGSTSLGKVAPGIVIAGTGDLNRDGWSDLLLQHDDGALSIWFVQQGVYAGTTRVPVLPGPQIVVDVGDLTGEGISDILVRNASTGAVHGMRMNNGQFDGAHLYGGVTPSIDVVGTGDFDGNGVDGILLRDMSSGSVSIWNVSDGRLLSSHQIGGMGANVEIVDIADFDGDSHDDILLRDYFDGAVTVWSIRDNGFAGSTQMGGVGIQTAVVGARDVNGDGYADVLLREASTGAVSAFLTVDGVYDGFVQIGGVGGSFDLIA